MPTVPRYDVPTATPQDIPDIRRDITAQTFGAGIGQALTGVGAALERGGDVLASNALRMQTLLNQADADTAATDWVIEQGKLDTEFKVLQGRAKADAYPEYAKNTVALRQKFEDGLKNQEAKRIFRQETRRLAAYSIRNAAQETATGLKQYNTESNIRVKATADLAVQGDPGNQAVFDAALQRTFEANQNEAVNSYWDREQLDLANREAESALLTKRIEALVKVDLEAAVKLAKEQQTKILGNDKNRVETAINTSRQRAGTETQMRVQEGEKVLEADVASRRATGVGLANMDGEKGRTLASTVGGPVRAQKYENDRIDAEIVYRNTADLATQTTVSMEETLARMTPDMRATDAPRQVVRFDAVKKAQDDRKKLRENDPAASVFDDPKVKEAQRTYALSPTDDNYKALGDARMAAQERAGVLPERRIPATNDEIRPMVAPIFNPVPGTEGTKITEVRDAFTKKFGREMGARVMTQALYSFAYTPAVQKALSETIEGIQNPIPIRQKQIKTNQQNRDSAAAVRAIDAIPMITPPGIPGVIGGVLKLLPKPTDESLSTRVLKNRQTNPNYPAAP